MELQAGIAEMVFSSDPADRLITRGLGSCVGLSVYDTELKFGGLLHVLLPESTVEGMGQGGNPLRFVDTGVPEFLRAVWKAGAKKEHLVVCAAGGAAVTGRGNEDFFQVGARNADALRRLLRREGLALKAADFGGAEARTMWLDIATGETTVRVRGEKARVLAAPSRYRRREQGGQ